MNVPGDFMCVNVMFDTNCEVSDIIKTTYRPCGQVKVETNRYGQNCDVENKNLEIPCFHLSLGWNVLHGCLMSSMSNLLNITRSQVFRVS